MNGIVILTSLLACVWLSWYITRRFVLFAMEQQLLDIPNARSSHSVVTPRGGGVSFVFVTLGSSLVLLLLRHVSFLPGIALLSGGAIAFIGYLDDRHSLSIKSRLLVQICGSAIAIYCLLGFPAGVSLWQRLLLFAAFVLATIAYTWLINFVNFMDGIDGLAASEAVCVASVCCGLVVLHSGFHLTALLFGVFAGAVLGFLVWNWHPAHIFMGDAGSGFIGYTLGALALFAASRHELSIWAPITLLGVFATDATMTLVRRMLRKEQWYEPHRLHAFQHASQVFGHSRVTAAVIVINLFWLAPFAMLAQTHPQWGPLFLIAAWSPLIGLMYLFHAGEVLTEDSIPRWRTAYLIAIGDRHFGKMRAIYFVREHVHTYMPMYRVFLFAIASFTCTSIALLSDHEGLHRRNSPDVLIFAAIFSLCQVVSLIVFELHRCHWHLLSIEEVPNLVGMVLASTLFAVLGTVAITGIPLTVVPRSEFVLQAILLIAIVVILQLLAVSLSRFRHINETQAHAMRVVIYGVDAAGVGISSDLRRLGSRYRIVGFVDPDKAKRGIQVAGGHVLGAQDEIRKLVDTYKVDQVLISSTSMHSSSTKSFVRQCRSESVDFRIIPSIESGFKARSEDKQPPAAA